MKPAAPRDALDRMRRRVAALGGLPTLPAVADEVARLTHDPKTTIGELAALIAHDPSLAARILKVANSAYYGMSRQVVSLNVACVMLGMKNVKSITTSVSIFRGVRDHPQSGAFSHEAFWEHSIACGKACELLAKRLKLDIAAEAFLAGLIHDIGKTVLAAVFREDFESAVRLAAAERLPFHEAERQVVGADHAEIGSWLAEAWMLPPRIVQAIALHHEPACNPADVPLAAAVQLADAAVRWAGLGFKGFSPPPAPEAMAASPLLAGGVFEWNDFMRRLTESLRGVKEFLNKATT